jgi:hypothetical protein
MGVPTNLKSSFRPRLGRVINLVSVPRHSDRCGEGAAAISVPRAYLPL